MRRIKGDFFVYARVCMCRVTYRWLHARDIVSIPTLRRMQITFYSYARACSPPRFDFLEAFKRAAYNKFPDRINREPGEFVAGNIIVRGRLEFFSKECM